MEDKALRSIPAQKWPPAPIRTMTLTSGFWSRAESAVGNSVKNSRDSALRKDGLFRALEEKR